MMGTSCAFATVTGSVAGSPPCKKLLNLRRSRFGRLSGGRSPNQATLASALLDGLQVQHIPQS